VEEAEEEEFLTVDSADMECPRMEGHHTCN